MMQLSIGYRLPKQNKQKSPETQIWAQMKNPEKRLNILSPPMKSEGVLQVKLPSIDNSSPSRQTIDLKAWHKRSTTK